MVRRRRRVTVRTLAIPLVLGIVLGAGLLSLHARTRRVQAQAADPGRAAVILDFFAAQDQGDPSAAAAMFADNAFYVTSLPVPGGTCSLQAPCYDSASALQALQATVSDHPCVTVTSIQVAGSIVTGRFEVRSDNLRSRGIERVGSAFMAEVRDGKIVSLFQRIDLVHNQEGV